jgi:UDP-N-acetylglucosamine 2-epimerase (non-hydrolysing)
MKRVLFVFGTRPEAIKMAIAIDQLKRNNTIKTSVAVTGQHREMLDQVLEVFRICPDYDLNIMAPNQDLFDISSKTLLGLKTIIEDVRPDLVLVQGDTTTTFIAGLSAFYMKIPVGHIEAGLRTGNPYSPFPEEINRKLTGVITTLHFAPTPRARENLLNEKVSDENIYVTGNTSIDALLWTIDNTHPDFRRFADNQLLKMIDKNFILVTTHRRESFGEPMRNTLRALAKIAVTFPDVPIIFPVHCNPNVRGEVNTILRGIPNVRLIDPLDYKNFAHLMSKAHVILTDSGGIQEEAPSLGKPVLVLRNTTERPEGIEAGNAKLVGTHTETIFSETTRLLSDRVHYRSMAGKANPYGDGKAAARIVEIIKKFLSTEGYA